MREAPRSSTLHPETIDVLPLLQAASPPLPPAERFPKRASASASLFPCCFHCLASGHSESVGAHTSRRVTPWESPDAPLLVCDRACLRPPRCPRRFVRRGS